MRERCCQNLVLLIQVLHLYHNLLTFGDSFKIFRVEVELEPIPGTLHMRQSYTLNSFQYQKCINSEPNIGLTRFFFFLTFYSFSNQLLLQQYYYYYTVETCTTYTIIPCVMAHIVKQKTCSGHFYVLFFFFFLALALFMCCLCFHGDITLVQVK